MQEIKAGDVVKFRNKLLHETHPAWYPPPGTKGKVLADRGNALLVKWQGGTSGDRRWVCLTEDIERQ